MNVITRAAGPGDIEELARFWCEHMNERLGLSKWRTIAAPPWCRSSPNHGWIALHRGRIVGAMALVHSQRKIRGRVEKLCNIGSLYVLGNYRGRGIARRIAEESTADESISYFGIDAAPQTRAVLEPWPVGFEILDDRRYVWRAGVGVADEALNLYVGEAVDLAEFPPAERKLFQDHTSLGMLPLVAVSTSGQCRALMWVRNKDSDTVYFEVFYMSDPACFAQFAPVIAERILADKNSLLAVDARHFPETPPHAQVERLKQPRHYKSVRLAPADIDLLYSEVPLLGLKLS